MFECRSIRGLVVVGVLLAACGGDDTPADRAEQVSADDGTATGDMATDDATTDDPAIDDEMVDDDAGGGYSGGGDAGDDGGGGGGRVDASGIDWATVDLTTIDWANIDLADLDLRAIEDNPTVDQISEADRAIIGERMAAQFGTGSVSLTIADRSWEFDGFQCAFESSGVLRDGVVLGTNLFAEVEGVRIQLQIDAYDDGTAQFTMDDIDDFENPSVSYLETTDIEVDVDGNTVTGSGDVTDQASANFDVVPMTFEGECGPDSLR
jgi:hypothetical protein